MAFGKSPNYGSKPSPPSTWEAGYERLRKSYLAPYDKKIEVLEKELRKIAYYEFGYHLMARYENYPEMLKKFQELDKDYDRAGMERAGKSAEFAQKCDKLRYGENRVCADNEALWLLADFVRRDQAI
ncbi:MAG: hypothetical protein WC878_01320 [Candidatus Paceibacterota bacterium]